MTQTVSSSPYLRETALPPSPPPMLPKREEEEEEEGRPPLQCSFCVFLPSRNMCLPNPSPHFRAYMRNDSIKGNKRFSNFSIYTYLRMCASWYGLPKGNVLTLWSTVHCASKKGRSPCPRKEMQCRMRKGIKSLKSQLLCTPPPRGGFFYSFLFPPWDFPFPKSLEEPSPS